MKSNLLDECITVHALLRHNIMTLGYKETVDMLKKVVANFPTRKKNINIAQLRKVTQTLFNLSYQGEIVGSCLSISLTIHFLLTIYGYLSEINIGVCVVDEKLFSHAWVEFKNIIIGEAQDKLNYTTIMKVKIGE